MTGEPSGPPGTPRRPGPPATEPDPTAHVRARAPGRVNLIGDHTDYTGGLVLPMAVGLGTTVELLRHGDRVELVSADEPEAAVVELGIDPADAPRVAPAWARYIAGVVAALRPGTGGTGTVRTDIPLGAGLSSSSALTVAVALALGFEGGAVELARACQRAEQLGSGVPGGIMDQLCMAAAVPGHALLIDCGVLSVTPVPFPDGAEVVVAHSGAVRRLASSAYAERRSQCDRAAGLLGPLRDATVADAESLDDPVLLRRARHVVTENARVLATAAALRDGDVRGAGSLMSESHRSLRDDFEVSTPELDALVGLLEAVPGVCGARLTGAGFGGCVVALAEAGVADRLEAEPPDLPGRWWRLDAVGGATVGPIAAVAGPGPLP